MKHLSMKQYIIGYEYQMVYSSTARDEKFKIEIKLQDGGSLVYYGTDEDVMAIHKLARSKTPINITLDNIGEV